MVATKGETARDKVSQHMHMDVNVMSAETLDVPLTGVGTVLRLERDAWSMVTRRMPSTNEHPAHPLLFVIFSQLSVLNSANEMLSTPPCTKLRETERPSRKGGERR